MRKALPFSVFVVASLATPDMFAQQQSPDNQASANPRTQVVAQGSDIAKACVVGLFNP